MPKKTAGEYMDKSKKQAKRALKNAQRAVGAKALESAKPKLGMAQMAPGVNSPEGKAMGKKLRGIAGGAMLGPAGMAMASGLAGKAVTAKSPGMAEEIRSAMGKSPKMVPSHEPGNPLGKKMMMKQEMKRTRLANDAELMKMREEKKKSMKGRNPKA